MAKRFEWKTIYMLLFILLATLVFSIIFPFYTVQEGLASSLSSEDISTVQNALDSYTNEVEGTSGACDTALSKIKEVSMKKTGDKTDVLIKNTIPLTIQQNQENKSCVIIDKIAALNPPNKDIAAQINTCYGKKYTAVLNMLNTINNSSAVTNDKEFGVIIKNQLNTPSVTGGMDSTFSTINQYISVAKM
jgi:hypothetical protein